MATCWSRRGQQCDCRTPRHILWGADYLVNIYIKPFGFTMLPLQHFTVFCVSISDHSTGEQGASSSGNPTLHCARGQNPQVSVSLMVQRGPLYQVCRPPQLAAAAAVTVLGPCWMSLQIILRHSTCVFLFNTTFSLFSGSLSGFTPRCHK